MKRAHFAVSLFVLTGCAGLIGVPDLSFDESGPGSPDSSTQNDGSSADGNTSHDGSTDANTSVCDPSKVDSDSHNCGRCGHDCLGGACSAGKCQSILVKGALVNPTDLAIDADNVYVTTRGDGLVLQIPKNGANAVPLATGQTEARGVALDGQNVYWSNLDFAGDGSDGYVGGVWTCTLPCTTKHQVTKGAKAANVRFFGSALYFAENNNGSVVRVQPDGNGRTPLVDTPTKPFSLAVDATHVYYNSFSGLERVPVGGGSSDTLDPLADADQLGFVTADADRVYYAYMVENGDGRVFSVSKTVPAASKLQYGATNKGSLGVAVDATNLYWTNSGTYDTANGYANNHDGEIVSCPKAGCGASPPVTIESGVLSPGAITTDGDAIYYLVFGSTDGASDGELRRIAKP